MKMYTHVYADPSPPLLTRTWFTCGVACLFICVRVCVHVHAFKSFHNYCTLLAYALIYEHPSSPSMEFTMLCIWYERQTSADVHAKPYVDMATWFYIWPICKTCSYTPILCVYVSAYLSLGIPGNLQHMLAHEETLIAVEYLFFCTIYFLCAQTSGIRRCIPHINEKPNINISNLCTVIGQHA